MRAFLVAAVIVSAIPFCPAAQAADKVKVTGQVYADNDFELYVNGKLVASDPIDFTPFNVVPVSFKASYPMTLAIRAKDYADQVTGLEYSNTKTGDGGLIAAFSNGVVTDASWRELTTFHGPTNLDQCLADPSTCEVERVEEPKGWKKADFDEKWPRATEHSRESVQPHASDYDTYDWDDASFVWGSDLVLDNTVLLRKLVKRGP